MNVILVVVAMLSSGCNASRERPRVITYSIERSFLEKNVPQLGPFERCVWYHKVSEEAGWLTVPGQNDLKVEGFVLLSPQGCQALLKRFPWESNHSDVVPNYPELARGFPPLSGDVLDSREMITELGKTSRFRAGKMLLIPDSNVVYFMLYEM